MSLRKLTSKWFGSLTNLSFRRSDKGGSKSSPANGEDSERRATLGAVAETVDDMGAMRPRTASYARSSDNYTHMGTMPRQLVTKKSKSIKASSSKKSKEKGKLNRSQSQRPAGDEVTSSPLLTALSSELGNEYRIGGEVGRQNGTLKNCPKPMPEAPGRDTKAISEPLHSHGDMSPPSGSDPVLQGTARSSETHTSPGLETDGRFTADDICRHTEAEKREAEYVQFSKEKYLLESPPEKLRKELEEELRLSPADIRSHAWYHGHIPREVSESLVVRNGDFLVRDSLPNVGDYVLTCRWDHEVLHFKISKVLVKSNESKVQYVLESDTFDTVQELVRFYVGQRRPVSQPSGAHIYCPVSRTLPLRYLEATFALAAATGRRGAAACSPSGQRGAHIKRRSVTMTDGLTAERIIPHSPSTIHGHKDSMRSCAMSMDQIQEYRCPLSPVGETPLTPAYSGISRHRTHSGGRALAVVPPSPVTRRSSEPRLSPSANNSPPGPLGHASHPPVPPLHHQSQASEGGYGSYCDLRPCPPKPPTRGYVERLREGGEAGGEGALFCAPQVEVVSSFRPSSYQSSLMPVDNKPLEMCVLKRVKELLAEVDAKTVAGHITMVDCRVARILGVTVEMQRMMGVSSGLELLTLPHGHQLRLDLLERFYTMSTMMAVDLLGCTGSTEERASLLHKTIQLAAQLKSSLGNMFGFTAVMRALELPQISRLEQTWMALRQRHTEGAILYEKTLKPFMKNMNDGKEGSVLANTSFPHVVPVLSLLERGVLLGDGLEPWESVETGVDVVMCHLEAARTIAHHGGIYRSNAEAKLQSFEERADVLEIFQTEFQMRLLWGSRGSEGGQSERYEKFDKVLTALSHKLEPPVRHSEL